MSLNFGDFVTTLPYSELRVLEGTMKLGNMRTDNRFAREIVLPVVLALALVAGMIALLLYLSAARTDVVSFANQDQLVSNVLSRSVSKLAKEQEAGLELRQRSSPLPQYVLIAGTVVTGDFDLPPNYHRAVPLRII